MSAPMPAPPVPELCPLCSTPLHEEQDWCLRCGAAARTRLAAPAKWRAPLLIAAVVIALSLGVLGAALVKLSEKKSAPTTRTQAPTGLTTPALSPNTTPPASATALPAQTASTVPMPSPSTTTPAATSGAGQSAPKPTTQTSSSGVLGRPNGTLTAKP